MTAQRAESEHPFEDVVEAVYDRLMFNERTYGKAWTGELDDLRFILEPALKRLRNVRDQDA